MAYGQIAPSCDPLTIDEVTIDTTSILPFDLRCIFYPQHEQGHLYLKFQQMFQSISD